MGNIISVTQMSLGGGHYFSDTDEVGVDVMGNQEEGIIISVPMKLGGGCYYFFIEMRKQKPTKS